VYLADAGHCIVAAVASLMDPDATPEEFLVPTPVRTVRRLGWKLQRGFVVVDMPYGPQLGGVSPEEDYEF
jgi:hypothetical protein